MIALFMHDEQSLPGQTSHVQLVNSSKWRRASTITILVTALIVVTSAYLLGSGAHRNVSQNTQTVPFQSSPTIFIQTSLSTADLNVATYTSPKLGVRFEYQTYYNEKPVSYVKEIGNTIGLCFGNMDMRSDLRSLLAHCYYLQVFAKDPKDALVAAIQKRFLIGYSQQDCLIKDIPQIMNSENSYPSQYQFAQIQLPDYNSEDPITIAPIKKCPSPYTKTWGNGALYFMEDSNTTLLPSLN
jgi:hypothetical protein